MPNTTEAQRSHTPSETIPGAVTASIAARPDVEAVVESERRVTYRELGDLSHTYPRDETPRIRDWLLDAPGRGPET